MKNEVAVVVGFGPGLGAAMFKRFANEGYVAYYRAVCARLFD
jgi:NAD(P)-dependent dehydrogenase (short-subunit alcohol dehydrogenase family)